MMKAGKKPSLIIIEDHPVMREGLSAWFAESGRWRILGTASNLDEAEKLLTQSPVTPDIALLDIHLRDGWGLDIIPRFAGDKSPLWAVYSAFDDYAYVNAAVSLGVKAYVGKHRDLAELEAALQTILRGGTHIDEDAALKFQIVTDGISLLTRRELEIFSLVKNGLSNKQIADQLGISRRTVENLLSCVYDKLGVRSRDELRRL